MANGKIVIHKVSDDLKAFIKEMVEMICEAIVTSPEEVRQQRMLEAFQVIAESSANQKKTVEEAIKKWADDEE